MRRLKTVGVMGSGVTATEEASTVGRLLAKLGVHLLTGGGGGQMCAVARAFVEESDRQGLSMGILPCHPSDPTQPKNEQYPNPYIEFCVRTHLAKSSTDPMSRNHINILTSDIVVALFGSSGTLSELSLAAVYQKPHCLFMLPETLKSRDCSALLAANSGGVLHHSVGQLEGWLGDHLYV